MSDLLFVTGATGKIGRHVCRLALERGLRVRALTRNPDGAGDLSNAGAELVEGGLGDSDLAEKMRGADAAYVMVPLGPEAVEIGRATHDAVQGAGIGRAVRLSVISAFAESDTGLGRTHTELDRDFLSRPFRSAVLRPHSFMENLLGSAHSIRQGRLVGGNGDGRTPYVAAADVAKCAVALVSGDADCAGTHDITGPASLNGSDVAAALSSATGHPVEWANLDPDAYKAMVRGFGMPDFFVELLVDLARLTREGAGAEPSVEFERLIGHAPEDLASWLARHRMAFVRFGADEER